MLNEPNLRKLARYLATLPDDYAAFEMAIFFGVANWKDMWTSQFEDDTEKNYGLHNGGVDKCGAVACAVGHGPSAGIYVPEELIHSHGRVNWTRYVDQFFISGYQYSGPEDAETHAFNWMFGEEWADIDNTPHGAAQRINWLLDNGVDKLQLDEDGWYSPSPDETLRYKDTVVC